MPEPDSLINGKLLIGVAEYVALPDLKLSGIATRIDTGAKTSALHVDHIEVDKAKKRVHFWFHPDFHDIDNTIKCSARLHDVRWVKSSNGEKERRVVVRTLARLGTYEWEIELTLTDRSAMKHLMLLGREALAGPFLITPDQEYLMENTG